MTAQIKTRMVRISDIIGHPAFALGFFEAKAGQGFSRNYEKLDTRGQWQYERGRILAIVAPQVRLKAGGKITTEAISAYARAHTLGEMR